MSTTTATPRRRGRPANTSSEETMAAVLTAARRLFAAKGYAGTSNREIAATAGLAHTAIYNHFGSKAQLFTAVFVDVQQLLLVELDHSVDATPERPLPGALLDAAAALRSADPSYIEFLASMYIEVRRYPELQEIFRDGASVFPVVERLTELSAVTDGGRTEGDANDQLWFWIAFALGLAQLSALADADTFEATLETFRRRFASDDATPNRSSSK